MRIVAKLVQVSESKSCDKFVKLQDIALPKGQKILRKPIAHGCPSCGFPRREGKTKRVKTSIGVDEHHGNDITIIVAPRKRLLPPLSLVYCLRFEGLGLPLNYFLEQPFHSTKCNKNISRCPLSI